MSRERSADTSISRFPDDGSSALAAWTRLRDQFDTSCIGLVAESGSGVANASLILKECWNDGTGPGAVALLGFSPDLFTTCASLIVRSEAPVGPGPSGAARGPKLASRVLTEWAPMVIFLPEDDVSVGECAGACRAMRSLGVPIRLEVMSSVWGSAAVEELVDEIDRFFVEHLTRRFPRLL